MKSVWPQDAYHFMMCQRIGCVPTGIIGFGIRCVASPMRTPSPPQKITTFIAALPCALTNRSRAPSPGSMTVACAGSGRSACRPTRRRTRAGSRSRR